MSLWLHLYPRAWRERYGDELEELLAREPRTLRQALDLFAGALDARLNPQWTSLAASQGERPPMRTFSISCNSSRHTIAEQRTSGLLMIGTSLALVLVYFALEATLGESALSQALLYSSFTIAAVIASLPTFLKCYPANVRAMLVALMILASYGFFLAVTLFLD